MELLFIDTETGGLDPENYDLVEVAWATLDDPEPNTLVIPHDTRRVNEFAKKVNQYDARGLGDIDNWATNEELDAFVARLEGVVLVGANIGFDESFLKAGFGFTEETRPWHYRKLDIESIAYAVIKPTPEKVPGMKDIYTYLLNEGFELPKPDHTAAGDVRTLIQAYEILMGL